MGGFKQFLKWSFIATMILLAVFIVAWMISRAMYPTDAQRDAMAEMEQPADADGRNAYALLWTLDRDVPEPQLDAVMSEDVRRYSERPPLRESKEGEIRTIESAAEGYPDLGPSPADQAMFCASRNEDCLARVREDLDAYVALIQRNRKLLDRVERLNEYDHVRTLLPFRMDTPLPSHQAAAYLRTRHAVRFAQGQTQEALADTCRRIATWRRLGANADTLITRLVGAAFATRLYGETLANMLSELPIDEPLPNACSAALAPPTVEDVSICTAVRGEYSMMASAVREFPPSGEHGGFMDRLAWSLMFDEDTTLAMSAEGLRSLCGEAEQERLRDDRGELPDLQYESMWRFECLGNFIGCTMNAMGWPGYDDYRLRLQDYGMQLRALGTLAWMRRNHDEAQSPRQLLTARPDDLKSPERDLSFGPEGGTLRVPLYDTTRGDYWSIPLPPALHAPAND